MVTVAPLDARDDDEFAGWYSALRAGAAAGRHAPLVVSAEVMRAQLLDQTRTVRHAIGAVDSGGRCVGTAVLERDTEHDVHLGEVDVNVRPEYRRQGIGSVLLTHLLHEVAGAGLTTLLGEVVAVGPVSTGLEFARRHGFESVHTEDRLVLDLPCPETRRQDLLTASDAVQHGYTMTCWSGPTPAHHLAAMAQLKTRMNAEVPTGDVDTEPEILTPHALAAGDRRREDHGYLSLVSLVTAADRTPVGYSQLIVQRDDPVNAIQDDTYVLVGHRGHRIATWLKVSNLSSLQDACPEARYVHTWTDQTNQPMHAINVRFGFRRVEIMHEVQRGGRASGEAAMSPACS